MKALDCADGATRGAGYQRPKRDTQREALQTWGIKQIYEIRKLNELAEIASVPIEDH